MEIIDVRTDVEQKIITGLIISTPFCNQVHRFVRVDLIRSDYARVVAKWCLNYFDHHKKAPFKSIADIFQMERDKLERSQQRSIFIYLSTLSREYASLEEDFDVDYYVDASRAYFTERSLQALYERGSDLVEKRRFDEAKELIETHRPIVKATTETFNPFDLHEIYNYLEEKRLNRLFKFTGVLGNYLGYFEKSWLVSWLAPEKRGKTWWLYEAAFQAIVSKMPTLFISFEMNKVMLKGRAYVKLTGLPERDVFLQAKLKGYLPYPVFDCVKNQLGVCKRSARPRQRALITRGMERPDYTKDMTYKPCTACRDEGNFKEYATAYWFDYLNLSKQLSTKDIVQKAIGFKRLYGDYLRMRSFPSFSGNFDDVERVYEELAYSEGFRPKLIILDYLDIMDSEARAHISSERGSINTTWKRAKQFADTHGVCVMTADQSTKASRGKRTLTEKDTSEDKRKDAHIDVKIGINQTEQEGDDNVIRTSLMLHRHRRVEKKREVMSMQQLELAQTLLDSEFMYYMKKNKKNDKK